MEFKDFNTLDLTSSRTKEFEAYEDFLRKKFIAFVEILKANVFSPNTTDSLKVI